MPRPAAVDAGRLHCVWRRGPRVTRVRARQMGPTMEKNAQPNEASSMARVVDRNIRALLERHERDEAKATNGERLSGVITDFTGSMRFVYLHLAVFSLWI